MEKFNKLILNSMGYEVVDNANKETDMLIDKLSRQVLRPRHITFLENVEDLEDDGEPAIRFDSITDPGDWIITLLNNERKMMVYPNEDSEIITDHDNGRFIYEIKTFEGHCSKNKLKILISLDNLYISAYVDGEQFFSLSQRATYALLNGKKIGASSANVENYYGLLINAIRKYNKGQLFKDENLKKSLDIIKKSLVYAVKCLLDAWIKSNDSLIREEERNIKSLNKDQKKLFDKYLQEIADNDRDIIKSRFSIRELEEIKENYKKNKRR